jgi:C4-dicarboxylate-specific signal transduction histidine kinase
MENNEQGPNEKAFNSFGKKIDDFRNELNEAGDRMQKEFNARYEELKQSAERLKRETAHKDRWKDVEDSLKRAGDELANAFKAAFKKRDEK